MSLCLIGLGSNLGDRHQTLERAIERLRQLPQTDLAARSGHYETPAIGGPAGQDAFHNAAVVLETALAPAELHQHLLKIENALGRQRRVRWDARTVDLDLLLYDQQVIDQPTLSVPHPRMAFRAFVLAPAAEVAGNMIHPQLGCSLDFLWQHIQAEIKYCALTGGIGAGKTEIAHEVARRLQEDHQRKIQVLAEKLPEQMLDAFYSDPASHGWDTELEFLRSREQELASSEWSKADGWVLSDYWFPQSLAFARTALDKAAYDDFLDRWRQSSVNVIQPTLTVVLSSSTADLVEAVRQRGRTCEKSLTPELIERLSSALRDVAQESLVGPRLDLQTPPWHEAVDEIVAAILAIDTVPVRL